MARAPLYVTLTGCVPQDVLTDIKTLHASKVSLLGGASALSDGVKNLTVCR